MVFSTPLFLFVYLSLTLLLYYAVPLKGRNLALLAVSLFFYAWGERIDRPDALHQPLGPDAQHRP